MEKDLIPGLPDDLAKECLIRVAFDHLSVVYLVCRRWRHEVVSSSFYHRRKLARIHRPIMIVKCTYFRTPENSESKQYLAFLDPTSGRMCNLHPRPIQLRKTWSWCESYGAVVSIGHLVVTIDLDKEDQKRLLVHIYDLITGFWREGTPMPGSIGSHFASASDGVRHIFVAGGGLSGNFLSALKYDVKKDTWDVLPDMIIGGSATGYFQAGIFYACPYYQEKIGLLNDDQYQINLFNLSTGDWTVSRIAKVKEKICWYRSTFAIASDGKVYYCDHNEKVVMVHESDHTWKKLCNLPPNYIRAKYFKSWSRGLLLVAVVNSFNIETSCYDYIETYEVYLLVLDGDRQNLSWEPQIRFQNQWRRVDVMTISDI